MKYESKMSDLSADYGLSWYCMVDVPKAPHNADTNPQEKMYWREYPSNIQEELFDAWKKFCSDPDSPSTKVAHIVVQRRHYRVCFMKDQIKKLKPCAFQMSESGLTRYVILDKPDKNGCIWKVPAMAKKY